MSEVIYNAVMGFVFTFDIVNVKDGPTRYKHASYYTLALLENAALLALWYTKSGGVDVSTSSINNLFNSIDPFFLTKRFIHL